MGLIVTGFALAAIVAAGGPGLFAGWEEVWRLLQGVRAGEATQAELQEALVGLPDGVRAQVVRHHQASSSDERAPLVQCDELPELEPGGAWAFAIAIGRGPALDQAILGALEETPQAFLDPIYHRGYLEFLAHSEAVEAEAALELAEALHMRRQAVWSGQNLAIARTRSGAYAGAAAVLKELLQGDVSEPDRALLDSRLTLVLLGEGGALGARRLLGASMVRGSSDSGIVLGLLSLESNSLDRSRALFRSVLSRDSGQPWAGRGWGLSMVPR